MEHKRIAIRMIIMAIFGLFIATLLIRNWMSERRLDELRKMNPKALIYEMYTPSWSGGFKQMSEHLERIAKLDVDYVWLTPCYPSGGFDGGYDVTDYFSIDPKYGNMSDFDSFVEKANELGIKVVMDLVLNHTSTQHVWFQKSLQKIKPYDLWSDEDLGWGTMFDGTSAFEWREERQEFYCHIYNKNQADLNWNNPAVLLEFQNIIDFWVKEHGVAGFRIDSAQLIYKDFSSTVLPRDAVGTVAGLLKYYQKPETPEIFESLFDRLSISATPLFTFGEMTAPLQGMFN